MKARGLGKTAEQNAVVGGRFPRGVQGQGPQLRAGEEGLEWGELTVSQKHQG